MLKVNNRPQLSIDIENHAVLEVIARCHNSALSVEGRNPDVKRVEFRKRNNNPLT
jgi:hypothetical protein